MSRVSKPFFIYAAVSASIAVGATWAVIADDEFDGVEHDFHAVQSKTIRGVAVTGANSRLGEPLWDLGEGLHTASFAFVFGHNDAGEDALPLTHSSSEETGLATGLESRFLEA